MNGTRAHWRHCGLAPVWERVWALALLVAGSRGGRKIKTKRENDIYLRQLQLAKKSTQIRTHTHLIKTNLGFYHVFARFSAGVFKKMTDGSSFVSGKSMSKPFTKKESSGEKVPF
jgi:hypothetical protein